MTSKSRVGISLRVVHAENYFEVRDAISHEWAQFLEINEMIPIFIPNSLIDVKSYLNSMNLDGLILSGGDNLGDNPVRDKTEKQIIEYGIQSKIPIFGVCRGMQILNDYFHGSICTKKSDHVKNPHNVNITSTKFSELLKNNSVIVNSFHNNTILSSDLGDDLVPFAISEKDNTIEGFTHSKLPILGIMWHPERDQNFVNTLILKDFLLYRD